MWRACLVCDFLSRLCNAQCRQNVGDAAGQTPPPRLPCARVDVDPDTANINLADLEAKLSPRTKVILFVHWGGNPVDLDRLDRCAAGGGFQPRRRRSSVPRRQPTLPEPSAQPPSPPPSPPPCRVKETCRSKFGFTPAVVEDCCHAFGAEYKGRKVGVAPLEVLGEIATGGRRARTFELKFL